MKENFENNNNEEDEENNNNNINNKENLENDFLLNEKNYIMNTLEMNNEYDEIIYFSHFCSVNRKLEIQNKKKKDENFPFLIYKDFMFSYFEEIKPIKEPYNESKETIQGRIKQFSKTKNKKFKKDFLNNLKIYSDMIGIQITSSFLIPSLAQIVEDNFEIKHKFLKVLFDNYINFISTFDNEGEEILKFSILNIIHEILYSKNYEILIIKEYDTEKEIKEKIEKLCFNNIIKIGKILLKNKNNEQFFLNKILDFFNEKFPKNISKKQKLCSIYLIQELCMEFSQEINENHFLPQLSFFNDDKDENIKKELLKTLPLISEQISSEMIRTKIYEILLNLSNDLNWTIRKIIPEILPKILKFYKEKMNFLENNYTKNFIELNEKFIEDNNRFVREKVIEKIGEFIVNLDKNELSQKMFDFYKTTIDQYFINQSKFIQTVESEELKFIFAFNFPAVLYCYGKESWNKLKNIFFNLCNENVLKIRKSLINSFHEICSILDNEIVENELLPLYNKFLESENKIEQKLSVKNLPKILKNISKTTKEKYFKYIEAVSIFQKTNKGSTIRNFNFINWKNKLDVVESILCYYNLYDNNLIYTSIFPQCITFCLDEKYLVRKTSSKVLSNLILYLYQENFNIEKLKKIIECFALNKNFQYRINFIKMCKNFLMNFSLYNDFCKKYLILLVFDKILNVKIALAKLFKFILTNKNSVCNKDRNLHIMCKMLLNENNNKKSLINIIKDIKLLNDIKEEEYFIKEDDVKFNENEQFFLEEFKIELPNKNNFYFPAKNYNINENNNIENNNNIIENNLNDNNNNNIIEMNNNINDNKSLENFNSDNNLINDNNTIDNNIIDNNINEN